MSDPSSDPLPEQRLSTALRAVDHTAAWVEWPVRRLAGSARLNPLPHAGTVSVFLLAVVVVSGLYLTLFFEFGHEASYRSVAAMEDHAIQRPVRALHRYASAVLVLTTVVHAGRIFAAGRFAGRLRRWRWATGMAALVLVWLAGVTGYWLVWDVRAQALNEIVLGMVGGTGFGVGLAVDHLGVVGGDRSGSGFLLWLWLAHLLVTVVICWFVWRHLRRTKQPWLPPPHWMALMGVPLVLVSLAFPLGMLDPADPEALVGRIPVDPFVLFLLPPLLSSWRWVTVVAAVVVGLVLTVLPRLLRRSDAPVVTIVEAACTGCELCVADCPYDALAMVERSGVDGSPAEAGPDGAVSEPGPSGARRSLLAVVDEGRCVGCGVCLGSCAFAAIDLPGAGPPAPPALDGRALIVACDRHLDRLDGAATAAEGERPPPVIHGVRCAGALAPDVVRRFAEQGASEVHLVGCAPADCRYGIGNNLAAQRLAGERRPHPPSRYARRVTQDWVAGDRVAGALAHPGEHPELDTARPPARRESLVGVGALALLTAVGVALATRAPFGQPAGATDLRLVVDHRPGEVLAVGPDDAPVGPIDRVEVVLGSGDGASAVAAVDGPGPGRAWTEILDLDVDLGLDRGLGAAGGIDLRVTVDGPDGSTTVVERAIADPTGRRIVVDLTDRPPPPGVDDGRRIFAGRTGGCSVCHSVERGDDGVGPSLYGLASAAGSRVEGLDADGYLRQSILLPDQYVLDGWPAGQMLPIYRDQLTDAELDAVIAYLLTLEGDDR